MMILLLALAPWWVEVLFLFSQHVIGVCGVYLSFYCIIQHALLVGHWELEVGELGVSFLWLWNFGSVKPLFEEEILKLFCNLSLHSFVVGKMEIEMGMLFSEWFSLNLFYLLFTHVHCLL